MVKQSLRQTCAKSHLSVCQEAEALTNSRVTVCSDFAAVWSGFLFPFQVQRNGERIVVPEDTRNQGTLRVESWFQKIQEIKVRYVQI